MKSLLQQNKPIPYPIIFLFAIVITLGISCGEKSIVAQKTNGPIPTEIKLPSDTDVLEAKEVQVAFAGGGWRAHTGHAGWIISLLENGGNTRLSLDQAFSQVSTIGSNSGGSWFNTMMAISPQFAKDIEAEGGISYWGTRGWLGQQYSLFSTTTACDHIYDFWYGYTLCVLDHHDNNSRNWSSIVENIIYKNYPIGRTTLGGLRNPWAKDKTLLIAASLLTSNVVLNKQVNDFETNYRYYEACHTPSNPVMGKHFKESAYCENTTSRFHEVTPVTFTGKPLGSTKTSSPFLPTLSDGEVFNMGYAKDVLIYGSKPAYSQLSQPTDNDNVPAILAATASSAALGFLSYVRKDDIKWWWNEAYDSRNLAPSFSLNGSVQFADPSNLTNQELSDQKIVRIADGGPVDNSGVAQIVKYFQMNNPTGKFNIVAFDNVTSAFPINRYNSIGVDLANLFGKGLCGKNENKFCFVGCGIKEVLGCVDVPELQIFDASSLYNTSETWDTTINGIELIYTKYEVITTENSNFGIAANTSGTLHAFTCVAPKAGTVPTSKNFDGYYDMLSGINLGLKANKNKGLNYLKAAMSGY